MSSPVEPYPLLTALVSSFAGLMALTAFQAFVIVNERNITSPFYKEFAKFFGKGGNLPVLAVLAFGIVTTLARIITSEFSVSIDPFWQSFLCICGLSTISFGWGFFIFGLGCVIYVYFKKYYEVKGEIRIFLRIKHRQLP